MQERLEIRRGRKYNMSPKRTMATRNRHNSAVDIGVTINGRTFVRRLFKLIGSAVCSECGKALPKAVRAAT